MEPYSLFHCIHKPGRGITVGHVREKFLAVARQLLELPFVKCFAAIAEKNLEINCAVHL